MAKKPTQSPVSSRTPAAPAKAPVVSPVRNTTVPKPQAPAKKEITFDLIAKRAYEIHLSGNGGSQDDNWFRAERELRGK
jgi:hypothetical protein